MSSGRPGPEAAETDVIKPGPLVDSMHPGLMRILGWEQTFAALQTYKEEMIEGSAKPDDLTASAEGLHRTLSAGPVAPGMLFDLLKGSVDHFIYSSEIGAAEMLLSTEDEIIKREQQAWVDESMVQEWLGEPVRLQRPPASVTRHDDGWGSQGPLYRGLKSGMPGSPYYRNGDIGNFHGRLQYVSLEQDGRVILGRGSQEATEIVEMFEAIKDPKTGATIGYVPRLSIERVSRSDRVRRGLRDAAVRRLGPELTEN